MNKWEVRRYDNEVDEIVSEHPDSFHLEVMADADPDAEHPDERYANVWIGIVIDGKIQMIDLFSKSPIEIMVTEDA